MRKIYPNCFIGKELIDWLIQRKITNNRLSALAIGENLRKQGHIEHVKSQHQFKDEHLYYRFCSDQMSTSTSASIITTITTTTTTTITTITTTNTTITTIIT